jgi:zinc transporter
MLPLSFVTGLLGVNIGGIPARDRPWAFGALCMVLVLVAAAEYMLLRRFHWVPGTRER